jgi:hypothetical protein
VIVRVRIGPRHPRVCGKGKMNGEEANEWGPVRIRVRIDPAHPHVCRKRRMNGTVVWMRPFVTVGVAL